MKISSEQIEGSQVVLNVEVEDERLERSMESAYRRIASKANIPGFRKGKAPRHMVERLFGREALLEEALERLIPEVYNEAVEEQKIDVIAQPKIELVQAEPLVFKATVPVRPPVELGDYHKLHFSLDPQGITDEDVGNSLEQMQARYAQWEPVDRPLAFGDMITADIENSLGDEASTTDTDINYIVTEDFPYPVKGFSEELIGMEKDGEKEFTLSFPEDDENPNLAAKEIKFKVKIKEIKEKKLPELDDEFAKTVSDEFENLGQLKERLRENLEENVKAEAKRALEEQIIDAVAGLAQVDYPEVMIEHEIEHLIKDDSSVPRDSQGRMDAYLSSIGKTEEEFKEQWRPMAVQKVLRSLVMQRVAELEDIKVTDEDVEGEIDRMASGSAASADAIRNLFASGAGRESIERVLLSRKTLDRLIEIVTTSDEEEHEEKTKGPRRGRSRAKKEDKGAEETKEEPAENKEVDA